MADREVRAAGLILRRRFADGWKWLLLKASKHGEWGFPKGHAEAGESDEACARRECAEECGIALLILDGEAHELAYRLGDGRRKTVAYFPATTCQEEVRLSGEHGSFRWCDGATVQRLLPHATLAKLFKAVRREQDV